MYYVHPNSMNDLNNYNIIMSDHLGDNTPRWIIERV